jgi:hypothetical protein
LREKTIKQDCETHLFPFRAFQFHILQRFHRHSLFPHFVLALLVLFHLGLDVISIIDIVPRAGELRKGRTRGGKEYERCV